MPFKSSDLSIALIKLQKLAFLWFWVQVNNFGTTLDATHDLWVRCICLENRAPSNITWLSLNERTIVWSVSLMIWNCKHFIYWAWNEISILTPISTNNLLSMLWNTWNLSLTLPVEKGKVSFFCTNNQNWMSAGPADIRGLILVRSKFDLLELSLTHGIYWNDIGCS